MKLTLSHFAFAALTAFTWMLLAFYPPWLIVDSSGGTAPKTSFYGYISVWEPPPLVAMTGRSMKIDLVRLLLQDVAVLVPILFLWYRSASFRREMEKAEEMENKYHGPEANKGLSMGVRIVLVLVTIGCIAGSIAVLKDFVHL